MNEDLTTAPEAAATPDKLLEITNLARQARQLEKNIAYIQSEIKRYQGMVDRILTRDLPEKMDAVGLRNFTVEADEDFPAFTISIATMYQANIAASWDQERRKKAFDWLEANGHGSLIKTDVITTFARDQRQEVWAFVSSLDNDGKSYVVREAVHPSTLKSWLKEMVERGETPPLDTIGGYIEPQAIIKEERE